MKRYWLLAAFGCAVLAFAAVWLGGLNQDEGWYLYAAKMVSEGKVLYRDFFYTQAPVMPIVYSAFVSVWDGFGILGARILTLAIGLLGIVYFTALARRLAPEGKGNLAALIVFLLLGSNLYHLYYIAIPKTYALASLFVAIGFYLMSLASDAGRRTAPFLWAAAGAALAFASGTRISLGAILAVVGFGLLFRFRTYRWGFLWFGLGGVLGLLAAYGFFVCDPVARDGLVVAQKYHAARGGFDIVWTVGSFSRLVRWYLPVFILLGLGQFRRAPFLGLSFAAVFAVQMLAPFPYEDYQVPVMGLLAVYAAVNFIPESDERPAARRALVTLGLAWACAFGCPLLEEWTTNGHDRFWTLKKASCELAQLQEVATAINAEDPGGKMLLTQDLYLAIETGRKVPEGLEMGPFSMKTDAEWREFLASAPCEIAALSGYSFAVDPPRCDERPVKTQVEYWEILKKRYDLVMKEDAFGQNATTLLVLRRKNGEER